jgi:beta-galactosidase/beta-glucuronidase
MDKKITQEELNGLSARARKAHNDSNGMIHETLTVNPHKQDPADRGIVPSKVKKEQKNEKL